jgi:pimeloyl-ACP methyl ester carboxylesterase
MRALSAIARSNICELSAPVVVIQGRADQLVRPAATRALVRQLRGLRRYLTVEAGHDIILPGCPAWPQVEEAVLDFAREVRGEMA